MEKVLELKKEQTSGLFGDLYEKKGVKEDSIKRDAVEPTLESRAVACKEALAEYLTLSRGLNSVFVLDREKFIKSKLRPAEKELNEREKEFQRALLNDKEIGMSLFSEPKSVPSYEEVAREMCEKSVSPLPQIVLTLAVFGLAVFEFLFGFNTVDVYELSGYWFGVIAFANFLFLVGLFGSRSALDSINANRVYKEDVSKRYNAKYNLARDTGITESLNKCVSAEVYDALKRLYIAKRFKLFNSLEDSVPYSALESYVDDRKSAEYLSLEGGSNLLEKIESFPPYKFISAKERLNVIQRYGIGTCDYSGIDGLLSHIDLALEVVAMRGWKRL